jgi:hypothetical protein
MANKGLLDTKIDVMALNEIIIFANHYRSEVTERVETIRKLCKQMEEEESLKGGDGDQIRANFEKIASGCNQLDKSTEYIVKVLNDKLGTAIKMRHGSTTNAATEAVTQAANKTGVLKE